MSSNPIQLPLFEDKTLLPTGKHHVSYSEISDHLDCSYKHKLKHVLKLDVDKPSIHTEFGRAIHDSLEDYIKTRRLPDPQECTQKFFDLVETVKKEHSVVISYDESAEFAASIPRILSDTVTFLDEEFPGWIGVAAEHPLFEPIPEQENKYFKGYIDSVIKVPKVSRRKKSSDAAMANMPMRLSEMSSVSAVGEPDVSANETQYEYWILDWKTTSWGWDAMKKRSFQKQLQLALYKNFYRKFLGLSIEQVKCGFVLLKRTPRKTDKLCAELVTVSVGPKTEAKAISTLNDMINQVKSGRTIKNRASCRYCPYSGTKECP